LPAILNMDVSKTSCGRACTIGLSRYVDPKVDGVNEIVTGSGQFGRCGDYADDREAFSKSRVSHLGVK
jgi:hypothetical protein